MCSAKEWSLGCVIPASWPPLAAGVRFTQPRDHSLADPCTYISFVAEIAISRATSFSRVYEDEMRLFDRTDKAVKRSLGNLRIEREMSSSCDPEDGLDISDYSCSSMEG